MNQRVMINIEVKKNENLYVFSMPMGANLGECYDAAFEVLKSVTDIASQAAAMAKPDSSNKSEEMGE